MAVQRGGAGGILEEEVKTSSKSGGCIKYISSSKLCIISYPSAEDGLLISH